MDGQDASIDAHNNSRQLNDHQGSSKASQGRRERGDQEPIAVDQYNQFMGGVDRSDQLLSYYGFAHRTVKWWREAFHLFDMAIVNSYVLYSSVHTGRK